jgi:hypothetical protein
MKRNGPASDKRTPYINPICGRTTYVMRAAGSRGDENRPAVANPDSGLYRGAARETGDSGNP